MMKELTIYNGKASRYLVLVLSVLAMVGIIIFNMFITQEIPRVLLAEKFEEKQQAVDGIAGDIDGLIQRDSDWGTYDYEWMLAQRMAAEDAKAFTFAALYSEALDNLSARHPSYTSAYEPLELPEFRGQVQIQEHGTAVLPFTPEGQPERDMHIYFRWVPTDTELEHRYLLVVAISEYSITNSISEWVSWGGVAEIGLMIVITFVNAYMAIRAGTFTDQRAHRWRGIDA